VRGAPGKWTREAGRPQKWATANPVFLTRANPIGVLQSRRGGFTWSGVSGETPPQSPTPAASSARALVEIDQVRRCLDPGWPETLPLEPPAGFEPALPRCLVGFVVLRNGLGHRSMVLRSMRWRDFRQSRMWPQPSRHATPPHVKAPAHEFTATCRARAEPARSRSSGGRPRGGSSVHRA
jgi:hypothetical protein